MSVLSYVFYFYLFTLEIVVWSVSHYIGALAINTFQPALVLVPTSLSRHQPGVGTSTNPIFVSLLKKNYWA